MTDHTADLAAPGAARIAWIRSRMPLLAEQRTRFGESRPFADHRVGMSLHLEPKSAVLLETLQAGGAEVIATGDHGSTQDDVGAHLRGLGMKPVPDDIERDIARRMLAAMGADL